MNVSPDDYIRAIEDCLKCEDAKGQGTYAMVAGVLAGRLGKDTCPFFDDLLKKEFVYGHRLGYNYNRQGQLI